MGKFSTPIIIFFFVLSLPTGLYLTEDLLDQGASNVYREIPIISANNRRTEHRSSQGLFEQARARHNHTRRASPLEGREERIIFGPGELH